MRVSVTTVGPKKHILRWREDGRQPSKTVNGTAREAHALAEKIEERLAGGIKDATKITLRDIAVMYLADGTPRWADSTLIGYTAEWNTAEPYVGDITITNLRTTHIKRLFATLAAKGIGQESQRKTLTRIRAIINFAIDEDLVARNVADRVKMPKKPVPEQFRPATPDEIERARAIYIERGQRRDAMIWSLLGFQVVRVNEVFGLRRKSVDLENGTLTIDARLTIKLDDDEKKIGTIADGDKRHRSRVIDLHPSIVAELREYIMSIGNPDDDELLFSNDDGEPMTRSQYDSWRRNRFKRTAKLVGRGDLTPKMLRHSSVSIYLHCLGAGKLAFIARQAGHSQTMLLNRYSHEIDGLEDGWGLSVEQVIQNARAAVRDRQGRVMLG